MRKIASYALAFIAAGAASLYAQEAATGVCATPESIIVTGNARIDTAAIRSSSGLASGTAINVHDIQTGIKALYATGQFDDVQIVCRVAPGTNKAALVIQVRERPILTDYKIVGADRVAPRGQPGHQPITRAGSETGADVEAGGDRVDNDRGDQQRPAQDLLARVVHDRGRGASAGSGVS